MENKIQVFKEFSEYPTTDLKEVEFLKDHFILANYIKEVNGATVYKYKKTKDLFKILMQYERYK